MDRDEVIKRIRAGLRARSGKSWSVRGGTGTSWGWIDITSPPSRCIWDWAGTKEVGPGNYPSLAERAELGKLLGLERPIHPQGETIPSSCDYYQEYVDRAEGRKPTKLGKHYWD